MGKDATTCEHAKKDLYATLFRATIKAGKVTAMIVHKNKDETRRSEAVGQTERA